MHCYYHRSQLALASCKCGKRLCLDCTNQAMEDLGICSDCKNELMMFAYLQFKEQALSIPTDQVKLKIEKEFLRCLMHPESPIGRMCSQCNRCYCQDCIHLKNGNHVHSVHLRELPLTHIPQCHPCPVKRNSEGFVILFLIFLFRYRNTSKISITTFAIYRFLIPLLSCLIRLKIC